MHTYIHTCTQAGRHTYIQTDSQDIHTQKHAHTVRQAYTQAQKVRTPGGLRGTHTHKLGLVKPASQTDRQTYRQADRQADVQTDSLKRRRTGSRPVRHAHAHADRQIYMQPDRQAGRPTDRQRER